MKKVLIVAVSVIAIILVAIPIIFLVFKDEIRTSAESEVNKQINGSISFCDLHISILRDFPNLTIVLEDVVVKGKGEFAMEFLKYSQAPRNIQDDLAKKYAAKRAAEQK